MNWGQKDEGGMVSHHVVFYWVLLLSLLNKIEECSDCMSNCVKKCTKADVSGFTD